MPSISRLQWHPFEYVAVTPASPGDAAPAMLLHVKAYNRWTRHLVTAVREQGRRLAVRAEGPYAESPAWAQDAGDGALVIAAGG